jgi:hypothetical protein
LKCERTLDKNSRGWHWQLSSGRRSTSEGATAAFAKSWRR